MKYVHVHIFLDIELDGALYPHKVLMAVPRLTEGDMLSSVIWPPTFLLPCSQAQSTKGLFVYSSLEYSCNAHSTVYIKS